MIRLVIAALWLCLGATQAHAFVFSAIAAFVGSITLASVGSAILGLGLSVGLSYISKALQKKPQQQASNDTSSRGTQLNLQFGGNVPRSSIFGWGATAGHFLYWNVYGPNNDYIQLVYSVGDGPHEGLGGLIVNGEVCALAEATDGKGYPVVNYIADQNGQAPAQQDVIDAIGTNPTTDNSDLVSSIGMVGPLVAAIPSPTPHMWVKFVNGYEDQAADPELVARANPSDRWTTDDKLSGIAHVIVTLKYNEKLFQGGMPQFLFVVQGRRCYDPRKDSTVGGIGAHRWSNPDTWEWTDNPAICLYNYQRGLYLGGELILGQGLTPADMITPMYVEAANICDELVALKDGGAEKRYRIGLSVGGDREHREAIQDFIDAMGGQLLESVGSFGPIAGKAKPVVYTFTDDDLITGKPVKFSAKRSRAELVNAVFGSFVDPAQAWQMTPFAPRTSSADELTDGERLATQIDYPQAFSPTQAQRLAEIERRMSREQATASVCLGFPAVVLEPGDWARWNSARYGDRVWQVTGHTVDQDETIPLNLREISASVFAWDEGADELDPTAPGDLPGITTLAPTVSGFALADVQINGAGGLAIPALRCVWSPVSDRTVDAVIVEYRVKTEDDSGEIKQTRFDRPESGEGVISEGIQAGTVYEARATIATTPARVTAYTIWVEETAPPLHIVPTAAHTLSVEYEVFEAKLKDEMDQVRRHAAALEMRMRNLGLTVAGLTAGSGVEKTAVRKIISAQVGQQSASIDELAQILNDVSGGLAAAYFLKVDVNGRISGMHIYATGEETDFSIIADRFLLALPNGEGTPIPLFLVEEGDDGAEAMLNGTFWASKIKAVHIDVADLSAISANIGVVTAGLIRSADDRLRIDLDNARIIVSDGV